MTHAKETPYETLERNLRSLTTLQLVLYIVFSIGGILLVLIPAVWKGVQSLLTAINSLKDALNEAKNESAISNERHAHAINEVKMLLKSDMASLEHKLNTDVTRLENNREKDMMVLNQQLERIESNQMTLAERVSKIEKLLEDVQAVKAQSDHGKGAAHGRKA